MLKNTAAKAAAHIKPKMNKEKIFIKNRKGMKISVLVELVDNPKGLAFVMHGLGGYKEAKYVRVIAESFISKENNVVTFDTTNTLGESDGSYENATTTNYYEDLTDFIEWAKKQKWYKEPFYLAGQSLGGICIALYAENNPKQIKALAPISTVISGALSNNTPNFKRYAKEWQRTGWKITESQSRPGTIKKLKWQFVEDKMKYDLLPKSKNLKMPVLMIVGEKDDTTPYEQQKLFYDTLPGKKEIHIIKGAEHTFVEDKHLKELKTIFDKWLDQLEGE